ncbi:MAG: DUF805 domain-containing protein [Bacteroidales bacterium]|nr:DUF805 domain-containing protein [Bacteroidales bacterium]
MEYNELPQTTFLQAVKRTYSSCSSKRIRRSEFWFFFLFTFLIGCFFAILEMAFAGNEAGLVIIKVFNYLVAFMLIIPWIMKCVGRLHDIGKSGWLFLLFLIPIIGIIILIVLFVKDSEKETNKYGPSPKYVEKKDVQS